jgi:hypothetical protein
MYIVEVWAKQEGEGDEPIEWEEGRVVCRGMIFGDFFRQHSKKASSSYNVQSPAAAAVRENCTVVPPHSSMSPTLSFRQCH